MSNTFEDDAGTSTIKTIKTRSSFSFFRERVRRYMLEVCLIERQISDIREREVGDEQKFSSLQITFRRRCERNFVK